MIETPKDKYPYAPIMKRISTWTFLTDYCAAMDGQIADICERVAGQPRRLENITADGTMQALSIGATLARPPSLVQVIIRESPTIKTEGGPWPCPWKVEYGSHSKETVYVKVIVNTLDAEVDQPARFDVLIFP